MSLPSAPRATLSLLAHPYEEIRPVTGGDGSSEPKAESPGAHCIWHLGAGVHAQDREIVANRPGGVALIAILPPQPTVPLDTALVQLLESVRPQGILPHHAAP